MTNNKHKLIDISNNDDDNKNLAKLPNKCDNEEEEQNEEEEGFK